MKQFIETDLSKIAALAKVREDENIRFRSFLKGCDDDVDKIVHRLHRDITSAIDCRQCANCCTVLKPEVKPKEIEQYARLEGISTAEYQDRYCEKGEFGDVSFKHLPCRYLDGKSCSIYEIRPQECRTYPHTQKKDFISRLWGMIDFYSVCPIVFNIMEDLKDEVRFRRGNRYRR
ncbi:MAG: YkgJ family cysteine cluster protein [Tannerellaceae bacterium]|jgi:Fe-S-cluster containining protein|nr:YkgJ family cysteine cluster protein [Tannerellaceae bacterium]